MYHSPKVDDGVDIFFLLFLETLFLDHLFPQGFRISKSIGHTTSGSGGKKTFKRYLKSEQTDTQHLCFEQAQPKMYHSPKVDDGVDVFF